MKITTQQIRQIISEELESVLSEAAVTVKDLPEDVYIKIDQISEDEIQISYVEDDGSGSGLGSMTLDIFVPMDSYFPCLKAMMVAYVQTQKGYGPLLYDIAIEIATMKAGGLVGDRTILSDDAYKVWDYYDKNRTGDRGDVKKIQLDNPDGDLTPDPEDDCLQSTSYERAKKNNRNWYDEPISRLYRKEPTTLDALKRIKRLILEDFEI